MVIFRSEQNADYAAIHAVHTASFPTTAEARLVDGLRAAGRLSVSLVAVEEGRVIGHVAFSPVRVNDNDAGVGLAPVAVLQAFRRRGIGAQLIRHGVRLCRESGYAFVVVLGDPGYYARFGFKPARSWGLQDEYGGGEAFQALQLKPGGIPAGGGLVRYAEEFSIFATSHAG